MSSVVNEIISLEELDPTTLVFSEPEADFAGKDVFYRINVERRLEDGTTMPLFISGVESKNPEEWCLSKLSVFEKDKKKNHSIQVAFQSKFPCQTCWQELYKSKIVDSLAKNLMNNKDKVNRVHCSRRRNLRKNFRISEIRLLLSKFLKMEEL